MSGNDISEAEKTNIRTSNSLLTYINKAKCHIGIVVLATSKFISDAGLLTALVGIGIVYVANCYSAWLILKARNRFKNHTISSLYDLGVKLYGEKIGTIIGIVQVLASITFCINF